MRISDLLFLNPNARQSNGDYIRDLNGLVLLGACELVASDEGTLDPTSKHQRNFKLQFSIYAYQLKFNDLQLLQTTCSPDERAARSGVIAPSCG